MIPDIADMLPGKLFFYSIPKFKKSILLICRLSPFTKFPKKVLIDQV